MSLKTMHFNIRQSIAFAALATGLVLVSVNQHAQAAEGWQSSYQKAMQQAKKEQRPLVLHFYADWCGPCRQMEASVLNQPKIKQLLKNEVIGVKINADNRADLVRKYGVTGLPTDVFVSPTGKVLSRRVGKSTLTTYAMQLSDLGSQYARPAAVEVVDGQNVKDAALGLEGFSPVALAKNNEWVAGKPELSLVYRGIRYRFANKSERDAFRKSPAEFAPKFLGCDPLVLAKTGQPVAGDIRYGAVYQGRIYLMSTAANQKKFVADPSLYARRAYALDIKDVKNYAMADEMDMDEDADTNTDSDRSKDSNRGNSNETSSKNTSDGSAA